MLTVFILTDDTTSAPGSFLFSLFNRHNVAPFKAPLKDEKDSLAMYRFRRYGPLFGKGHDLVIHSNANSNTHSYANLGSSYEAPSGYTFNTTNTKSLLAGSYHFTPSELEVFYLN